VGWNADEWGDTVQILSSTWGRATESSARRSNDPRAFRFSVLFEVLNLALVVPCFFKTGKGSEVAALASGRVLLARVQAVFTGFEFADHT
jgi:hypothetical protein